MSLVLNKEYYIISFSGRGRYLNVYGTETVSNGSNVCLYDKVFGAKSQKWIVRAEKNYAKVYTSLVDANTFAINISSAINPNCTMYKAIGNDADSLVDLLTVDAEQNLYKIKLQNNNLNLFATGQANFANVAWKPFTIEDDGFIWKLVAADDVIGARNFALYPCKTMRITQSYTGKTSHLQSSAGFPWDYPIDEGCDDGSRSWIYCPCDKMEVLRIYGVGNSGTNAIWLRSTTIVDMPSGRDYLVLMVLHSNDEDLRVLSKGQTFSRGQPMFREGSDGATANHFHISVGTGNILNGGWVQNNRSAWVLTTTGKTLKPEEAFYIDFSFNTIISSKELRFSLLP